MSAPNQHRDVHARVLFCLPNLQPQRSSATGVAGPRPRQTTVEPNLPPGGRQPAAADRGSPAEFAESPSSRQNAAAMAFSNRSCVAPESPNRPAAPEISRAPEISVYQTAARSCWSAVESVVEYAWSGDGRRFLTPLAIAAVVFAAWALGRQSATRPPVVETTIAAQEATAEPAAADAPRGAALAAAVAALDDRPAVETNDDATDQVAATQDAAAQDAAAQDAADAGDEDAAEQVTAKVAAADQVADAEPVAVADATDGGFYLPEDSPDLDFTAAANEQLKADIERAAKAAAAEPSSDTGTEPAPEATAKDAAPDTAAKVVQVANQSESDDPEKTATADEAISDTATTESKTSAPVDEPLSEPQPRHRFSTTPNAVPDWSRYIPGATGNVRSVSAESEAAGEGEDVAKSATETLRQAFFLNEGPWAAPLPIDR